MGLHYQLIYGALLALLASLVTSIGETDFDDRSCGRQLVSLKGLIKGGYNTRLGEFPWHVALFHRAKPSSGNFEYRCGGSLIHKYLVLTAAHCVTLQSSKKRKVTSDVLVKVGRYNISEEREEQGRDHEVAAIITHSGYKPLTYENDIAIVRLVVPVIFTKYVQPVCLWKRDDGVLLPYIYGSEGTVVGWGLTDSKNTSSILNTARMPVVDMNTCLASNRDFFGHLLYANSFCAGSQDGTGVCNGDSGGGMVFKHQNQWYLRGVVSFSNTLDSSGLCNLLMYVGFTDAGAYLQWIYENAPVTNNGDPIEGHPNIRFINQGSCGINDFKFGHSEEQKPIIKQYPWMVHLRHPLQNHEYVPCNGVLINKNYILTTTCVDWNDDVSVTLGDYRTNEVRDCAQRNDDQYFCLDPVQINSVAEWSQKDNLILARLASPARIGRGNIEAACLPTSPELRQRIYRNYILTGWKESGNDSHYLQRAVVDYIQPKACKKEFDDLNRKQAIRSPLCVRNVAEREKSPSCNDYQPGTLLQAIDQKLNRYFAYGVQTSISYCSVPELFIKVVDSLEWILDTIKP